MARSKPSPIPFHELPLGQTNDFFVLLAERTLGVTRDGKPFYSCRFKNSKRTASFMVWAESPLFSSCEKKWKEGEFYKIRGRYLEHRQYGPQIEIHKIRSVNEGDEEQGFSPEDFVESTRFDIEEMFSELQSLAENHISNEPLRNVVVTLLERYAEPLKTCPATKRHYYPFRGGLLEHTLSVTNSCLDLVERYSEHYPDLEPPLNTDLVVAGAILHDLGRLLEWESGALTTEPTVPGRLLGHLLLSRDLVRDTARELGNVDPEVLQLLEHVILSHLNHPEWGSPRLPLMPECLILHHADDLDAKMEMYVRCLTRDSEDSPFTARDPVLGRQLLKKRKV